MAQKESPQSFVKRHAKTPEQIAEEIVRMETAKKDMTQDSAALEANLREFNDIIDPILNPNSGKPMCWVRRPSQKEWEEMIPAELMKYRDAGKIPEEIAKKYADQQFQMMAKLIAKPTHDAIWWKANSNILFQEMFQVHLMDMYRKLGLDIENF
jgi:hypothetical protein